MKFLALDIRLLAIPLFLFAGSCTNDPGEEEKPPSGSKSVYGGFHVNMVPHSENSQGYTTVLGKFFDGASPSPVGWKEAGASGSCKVFIPKIPFCPVPCDIQAACVEDGVCQDYADPVVIGQVTVEGLATKAGATSFAMNPIANNYQPANNVIVAFPPFAEGGAVTFSASGDTAAPAFAVSSKGIPPLALLNDTISLEDGKPVILRWTPPAQPGNSRISVDVDISHHGGSRGMIECEGPDTGEMAIAGALVDQLKALGISGFPKLEIARKAVGVHPEFEVELVLESRVTKYIGIPGLISCSDDPDCPDGQTCADDMQCK